MSTRVTKFPICDAGGTLIAVHERHDHEDGTKSFYWVRNGRKTLDGLPVSKLPLFGSEDVASWPADASILLVEGEKAREALKARGFLALATVTGASGCPDPEPLDVVRGHPVIVWPDADEVGRSHMTKLAARVAPIAASVRWFEWTGAPPSGDASDYLDSQEAAKSLKDELRHAKPWTDSSGVEGLVHAAFSELGKGPAPSKIANALRSLAKSSQSFDALDLAAIKCEAVAQLKARDVRHGDAHAMVRAAMCGKPASQAPEDASHGIAAWMSDPEPWPDEVEGAALADEIASTYGRHIDLPQGGAEALTLWTLNAHAHDASLVSPLMLLTSAEKRSGKTTVLFVMKALVPRPIFTSNITASALYRVVEQHKPTLLMDEAETYTHDNEAMRGVMNSGHSRDGANVVRCEGDSHETRLFSAWCPKVLAMIGRPSGTIEDRAVNLTMRRKAPGKNTVSFRLDKSRSYEPLRRRAWRWAQDHMEELRESDPTVPLELNDRAQDNWRPLMAIADALGGDWPRRARQAALTLAAAVPESESAGEMLLADIRDLFCAGGVDRLSSQQVVAGLVELEGRPWGEWRGKALTKNQLASLLKRFEIAPRTIKLPDKSTAKGYHAEQFEEAWSRYLSSEPSPRNHPPFTGSESDSEPSPVDEVVGANATSEAAPIADGYEVTDVEAQERGGGDALQEFMGHVLGTEP